MIIERLDGFTADGFGKVVSGNPQDGDVIRIDKRVEQRYYAPVKPEPKPTPKPVTKEQILAELVAMNGQLQTLAEQVQVLVDPPLSG